MVRFAVNNGGGLCRSFAVLAGIAFIGAAVTGCPMAGGNMNGNGNANDNGNTNGNGNTNDNVVTPTGVPVASKCAAAFVGCYDEISPQSSNLVLYRPATRWAQTNLTWRMLNFLPQFEEQSQLSLVERAFQAWSEASALTFEQSSGETDLVISFESGDHGDMFPFDGADGTLGHGFFPSTSLRGTIHINADKDWSMAGETGFDLYPAFLHEIGHSLGVEHVSDDVAIMNPGYVPGLRELSLADIDAVQRLYGDADHKVVPAEIIRDLTQMPNLLSDSDEDSDEDLIPDSLEVLVFGTDPLDADTDGDGIDDFDELFRFGTDPLRADTAGDGDEDEDGLSDTDEADFFGTDPFTADTDGDGLGDGDEAFYYFTDPLEFDSDGDGLSDFDDPYPWFPFFGILPGVDVCEVNGWYGDLECDTFCPQADPDCDDFCFLDGLYGDGFCDPDCPLYDFDCDNAGGNCVEDADCDDGDPCTADICLGDCFNEPADCGLCFDDCVSAFDGECDDGGPGSLFDVCEFGSDCADCGFRNSVCSDTCAFSFDGECDDGGLGSQFAACALGTDCSDCGPR